MTDVRIDDKLRYEKELEPILDEKITKLRNKEIVMVLVKWKHHRGPNLSWETKVEMVAKYPQLFNSSGSCGRDHS